MCVLRVRIYPGGWPELDFLSILCAELDRTDLMHQRQPSSHPHEGTEQTQKNTCNRMKLITNIHGT